jgi:hypothetical protein
MELPKDVTMVNYEVMTSKKDFGDLLEGTNRKRFSKHLDLSPKSRQSSSSQPNFSFEGSRKTLGFDSLGGRQPLSSQQDLFLA